MNIIDSFQDLVGQVNEFVQPIIVAAAGAIPFVEGEGAATIGVLGGLNPVVAAVAGIVGNFICVAVLVLLSARARTAVVTRTRARTEARAASSVAPGSPGGASGLDGSAPLAGTAAVDGSAPLGGAVAVGGAEPQEGTRGAVRRAKFQRAFERYGVPGVSLLGPLLLPTQFTATMLAASGIGRARILIWQAVAIVGWTTIVTLIISGVITSVR